MRVNSHVVVSIVYVLQSGYHSGRVRSPFQKPSSSPVSLAQSRTPVTAAFAIPVCVPDRLCRVRPLYDPLTPTADPLGSWPGLMKLLPWPVAYSDPMLGSTCPSCSASSTLDRTHCHHHGTHILPRTQTNKQREGHQPHAEPKETRNLRKGRRLLQPIVIIPSPTPLRLFGKMTEP